MIGAAMHDAVADGRQPIAPRCASVKLSKRIKGIGERMRRAGRPAPLGQDRASGVAGDQMRRAASRSSISPRTVASAAAPSNRANFSSTSRRSG